MAFDPSTSSDPAQQGFTTLEIDDLPCETPARSKCDTLYDSHSIPTTAQRQKAFGVAETGYYVEAHKDAQWGEKAGGDDDVVKEEGIVEMDSDD